MLRSWIPAMFTLGVLASTLSAQAGNGGNGQLDTSPPGLGQNWTIRVSGAVGAPFSVYLSSQPAQIALPGVGTLWIDPSTPDFGEVLSGVIPVGGVFQVVIPLPIDPALLSVVAFAQGAVGDGGQPSGIALTRAVRVDFEASDSFAAMPSLSGTRALATADLLLDGRVLLAGGGGGSITAPAGTATTEIFNPYLRSWSPGPSMSSARAFAASARLADGRLLVIGGANATGAVTASCDIFDPVANTWGGAAPMNSPRCGHSATVLNDGRIFVAGGVTNFQTLPGSTTPLGDALGTAQNTGEIYNPNTNSWTNVPGTMASRRFGHTQTLRADGRVLCASGLNGATTLLGIEIPTWTTTTTYYNPVTNAFSAGPALSTPRVGHRATLMGNGEVFLSGGLAPVSLFGITTGITTTANCVRLNTGGTAWSAAGNLPAGALMHGQVLLKNGKAHISGGGSISLSGTTIVFGGVSLCGTYSAGATVVAGSNPLPGNQGTHAAVLLLDGSVLIAGGSDGSTAVSTTLLYTPIP